MRTCKYISILAYSADWRHLEIKIATILGRNISLGREQVFPLIVAILHDSWLGIM